MASYFRDAKQDQWEIVLDFGTIRRVRDRLDGAVDLFEPQLPEDKPIVGRLQSDIFLLYDVLYAILGPQCKEREIDEEEFGRRMAADSIAHARDALYAEWAVFLRDLQEHLKALAVEATRENMARAATKILQEIDRRGLKGIAEREADKILSEGFSKMPASSDSLPSG